MSIPKTEGTLTWQGQNYQFKIEEEIIHATRERTCTVLDRSEKMATIVSTQVVDDHIQIVSLYAGADSYYSMGVALAVAEGKQRGLTGRMTARFIDEKIVNELNRLNLFEFTTDEDKTAFEKLNDPPAIEPPPETSDESWFPTLKFPKKSIAESTIPTLQIRAACQNELTEIADRLYPLENEHPADNGFIDVLAYICCFIWITDLIDVISGWFAAE